MYCKDCLDFQTIALRQVESLLTRLEAAEDLFPSNKSMGGYFPIYQSTEFINRIKALNQWYNITRHHRLKLMILGKVLAKLQGREYKWPLVEDGSSSGSSSVQDTENDSARGSSAECGSKNNLDKQKRVQFDNIDETDHNSSDSANSDDSFKSSYNLQPIGEYGILLDSLYSWKVTDTPDSTPATSPYRKFIENVLKSRGLGKSLSFLHKLHNDVLRKAVITLEKPGMEDIEHELFDDEVAKIEIPLDQVEAEELRRYGIWCDEFKELSLPPYISAFLFLSKIPLEVVHEFMKMKLETKPINPNPLSLEQLIKELKEGLTLALIHRDRYNKHIVTALVDRENEADPFLQVIDEFDRTLKQIFELYLEYVEQWILIGVPTSHRKTALEDEWRFTKLTCPMINGEHKIAANRFCEIIQKLFDGIGKNLIEKVTEMENFSFEVPVKIEIKDKSLTNEEVNGEIDEEEEEEDPSTILKNRLLTMCRETQQLFTDERDKCVKLMTFTKTLFKDIEKDDFHRDHNTIDDSQVCLRHSSCMCTEVLETINSLKRKMLLLREKLTSTLLKVQERSETRYMSEMEEADRITVLTRFREILHVGYKFGFEYHKNLSALFETTTVTNSRSSQTDSSLAKAIVGFAKCWMNFVMERCERGRGLRPRWAAQGLEFLIIACDPHNTEQIDETEFEELKSAMDKCISHVIGSIHEPDRVRKSPRSRKSSPAPTRRRTPTRSSISYTPTAQKVILQQLSVNADLSKSRLTPSPDPRDYPTDYLMKKQISYENVSDISIKVPDSPNSLYSSPELRQVRIRDAINHLDLTLENNLRSKQLIGNVKELSSCDKVVIRDRSVKFSWHRGIKIGQGRFGKFALDSNFKNSKQYFHIFK
jgi:mitogen-activated protein kinase kinase kinase 4